MQTEIGARLMGRHQSLTCVMGGAFYEVHLFGNKKGKGFSVYVNCVCNQLTNRQTLADMDISS